MSDHSFQVGNSPRQQKVAKSILGNDSKTHHHGGLSATLFAEQGEKGLGGGSFLAFRRSRAHLLDYLDAQMEAQDDREREQLNRGVPSINPLLRIPYSIRKAVEVETNLLRCVFGESSGDFFRSMCVEILVSLSPGSYALQYDFEFGILRRKLFKETFPEVSEIEVVKKSSQTVQKNPPVWEMSLSLRGKF